MVWKLPNSVWQLPNSVWQLPNGCQTRVNPRCMEFFRSLCSLRMGWVRWGGVRTPLSITVLAVCIKAVPMFASPKSALMSENSKTCMKGECTRISVSIPPGMAFPCSSSLYRPFPPLADSLPGTSTGDICFRCNSMHARTHARTHVRTYVRTYARTHAPTRASARAHARSTPPTLTDDESSRRRPS